MGKFPPLFLKNDNMCAFAVSIKLQELWEGPYTLSTLFL